jgi:alpha-tubulin suppressor-like RCC1 family protein
MRTNLFSLQKTSGQIDRTQERLSTGKKVNSALDNPTNFFAAQASINRANDLKSRKDGMTEAVRNGEAASAGLKAITSLIDAAKGLTEAAFASGAQERDSLSKQYNEILKQLDSLVSDSGYRGTNLLNNQSLVVNFNENASSNLQITGFDATSDALGIGKTINSGYWGNITTVSSGYYSPLAINSSGSAFAWDDIAYGQTTIPVSAQSNVTSIAKGDHHSLVLKSDGSVVAWGDNSFGQATVPAAALSGVIAIAATAKTSFALKSDGSVVAWGQSPAVNIAALTNVVSISASLTAAYALKSDGSVVNINTGQQPPPNVSSGIVSISTGTNYTVALKNDSTVVAWDNTTKLPVAIPSIAQNDVAALAVGASDTMVLKRDGTIYTWNNNTMLADIIPPTAQNGVVAISNKYHDPLVLKNDGTVVQWNNGGGGLRYTKSGVVMPELSWQLNGGISQSEAQLDAANSTLRKNAVSLSSSLSVITIRQDFTNQLINTLETGADNLTLADMNEEAANMLILQTRQNLGTTSLSLASQASQSVMKLFS